MKQFTKDSPEWKNADTVGKPLHPALEAFSQVLAEILVDRYLQRKHRERKGNGEGSARIPGDFDREGCHE